MMMPLLAAALTAAMAATPDLSEAAPWIQKVTARPEDVPLVTSDLAAAAKKLARTDPALARAYVTAVARNLREKAELGPVGGRPFTLTRDALARTVLHYERFKQDAFIRAGVFPKRYFGYFDEAWDTAAREARMKEVVRAAVGLLNASQQQRGSPTRITDQEVAVTFIAEGGALLLRERQAQIDDVHPVYGVGLDDIATGFARYAAVLPLLDEKLGTDLRGLILRLPDQPPTLRRNMTFDEAILGTAVMWLYEKELCAQKLKGEGRAALESRAPEDQFILASLVYNSGILFSEERLQQIRDFSTADYLAALSKQNASRRWPLPLETLREGRARLQRGDGYPDQPTSWSAVYHVLQRWGGYAGLQRFTGVFDAHGMYR